MGPSQSEHTRRVLTRTGYQTIPINTGFKRTPRTKSSSTPRPSLQAALQQLSGTSQTSKSSVSGGVPGGGPSAKSSLVLAISGQEERIAAAAYGFREVADDLASGAISVDEAQGRSRSALIEMETHMAAVEYAASRISPEFAEQVAENHDRVRDRSIDSLGYLVDIGESSALHDEERSAAGFRAGGADPLYDATRDSVDNLQVAAAQEIAAQYLPEAAMNLDRAFRKLSMLDEGSVATYRKAEKELFEVTKGLQGMEEEIGGSSFHANQMVWVVEEMSRVAYSGGNKEGTVSHLWAAVDSFQGGFGLSAEPQKVT